MGSSAKWYCVLGAGSVTGMFCCRELLQRGGNVRACCRNPDAWRADIESLVSYFPRGKRGILEFVAADVTKAETLGAAVAGCEAVIFTASGSAWSGPGGSYDVDYKVCDTSRRVLGPPGGVPRVHCVCTLTLPGHTPPQGVELAAAAAKAAGVRKFILVSCFMVSGASRRGPPGWTEQFSLSGTASSQ
jgi:NAD(P)-dependent dehydrogenase (short-subunit alcohol dehydrogenase family)